MKSTENKAKDGGPSGARSRDLRIKRPCTESLICLRCGGIRERIYTREPRANCWVIKVGEQYYAGDEYKCFGNQASWSNTQGMALQWDSRNVVVGIALKLARLTPEGVRIVRIVRLATKAGGVK